MGLAPPAAAGRRVDWMRMSASWKSRTGLALAVYPFHRDIRPGVGDSLEDRAFRLEGARQLRTG